MKTPEEKIQFKNHFFKLGQGRVMPLSDAKFWLVFWTAPHGISDIFDLLTPYDIQTVRDQNLPNFLLLVRILSTKVVELANDLTPKHHAQLINCLRFLARVLPFTFELPNYSAFIEPRLFWSSRFDPLDFSLPNNTPAMATLASGLSTEGPELLAYKLTTSLVELLFVKDFTVGKESTLWEPGIGGPGKPQTPEPIFDANRTEVLRLILVLMSFSFYQKPSEVIHEGSRFATLLVTTLPRTLFVNLVCSLLNIACRSARKQKGDSGLETTDLSFLELRYTCVKLSMQLLASMFVYPMPTKKNVMFLQEHNLSDTKKPVNMVRLFFGKLSKESELSFIGSHLLGLVRVTAPQNNNDQRRAWSKARASPLALEAIIILWELLQCNKQLRSSFADRIIPKLVPTLLYYVFAFHDVALHSNLVKVSAYFLLYISSQENWVEYLVLPMPESSIEILPAEFRVKGFTSTRDFLVIQTCQILSVLTPVSGTRYSNLPTDLQNFLLPTLVEILYNVIPVVNEEVMATDDSTKSMSNINPSGGLSYQACISLTQVLVQFLSKQFILEAPRNAEMLALILRAVCCAATKYPTASRMLLFSFFKNEKTYDTMWNIIYSLENEYFSGESLKLLNVQEDDENADNDTESLSRWTETPKLGMFDNTKSPDQFSIDSPNLGESNMNDFKSSLNSSVASLVLDKSDTNDEEERELEVALRPQPPAGMSDKAKEKFPQETPINRSWGGNDALRIIVTVLIPHLKELLGDISLKQDQIKLDNFLIVKQIEHSNFEEVVQKHKSQLNYDFLPHSPVDKLLFSWSHLSLGWYTSVLYEEVLNSTENMQAFMGSESSFMKGVSSSLAVFSKFASSWTGLGGATATDVPEDATKEYVVQGLSLVNVWKGTNLKLFRSKLENDKLGNAFGLKFGSNAGVGDLTNSLVRRFSDFRTNSRASVGSINSVPSTLEDVPEGLRLSKRNSVSSLHTLNTLNRSRSNTPRNSIS